MASLCESVVVTRCSSFGTSVSVPVKASAICSLLCERKVRCLPEPKGLRIQLRSLKRSVMASRIADRAGVVVCEAQKTAVEDLPSLVEDLKCPVQPMPAVTEATWQSFVMESDMPVLVEFWAPWCGPCRMIDPIITELSKTYAGKLKCF